MDFERIIEFEPAWDKRSDEPGKDYGIHGMEARFVLKKDNKAVQFVVYTNWHLPHVEEYLEQHHIMGFCPLKPMAADLGYHSPTPTYENQQSLTDNCKYTGGVCYYDGSGLQAKKVFAKFVAEGLDALWEELEAHYNRVFEESPLDKLGYKD
jgi:hypothetical protein